MTTPTNHAIGILSDTGVEVLIHVGLETVSLNGEGFKRHIEEGSRVNLGDVLIDFDIKTIQEKNLSLFSPVVITNSPEFLDIVVAVKENEVIEKSKEEVLIVVN